MTKHSRNFIGRRWGAAANEDQREQNNPQRHSVFKIEHDGDSQAMEKFLEGLGAGSQIAIEATGSWWWVVDLAEKHGHEVVLSNPKDKAPKPVPNRRIGVDNRDNSITLRQ